jgi:flagellar basal-body rod protein FlgG
MIDALYISASGLRSEQKQIDVVSNNVANMQTPGFKRSRVNFAEMATAPSGVSGTPASGTEAGAGTQIQSVSTLFGPGELRMTRNPLDLAIEGAGFFELQMDDGSMVYTRDGQFRVDAEGYLTSVQGLRLSLGLQIPPDATDVQIAGNGEIRARLAGETELALLGTIELASFPAADALQSVGGNNFAATESSGIASYGSPGEAGVGRLQQGYVEMANVEMVEEMTTLVLAQRAYQLNARVLQASDQLLETINNLRR